MIINIASKNPVKVEAVRETIRDYDFLSGAEVKEVSVESEVSDQPKSLKETITGAMNRARNSFSGCDLSVGLESGLIEVPFTKTGYMDLCACAIFDGRSYHLGLSRACEFPIRVTKRVFDEGIDIDAATFKEGLTDNRKVGSVDGLIGFLTKGLVKRKEYTKDAVKMALIHLQNPDLY